MTRNYFCQEENVRFFDRSTCTFNFIGTLTLLLVVLFISPVICFGADSTTVTAGLSGVTAVNPTAGGDSNRFGGIFAWRATPTDIGRSNYCMRPNPYTGGCSCPGGYWPSYITVEDEIICGWDRPLCSPTPNVLVYLCIR